MTKTADTRPAGAQFMQTFVIDQHEGSTREGSTVQDQAISKDTDLGGWQAKEESVVTSRRRRGPPAAEGARGTTPPHPSISCSAQPSCFPPFGRPEYHSPRLRPLLAIFGPVLTVSICTAGGGGGGGGASPRPQEELAAEAKEAIESLKNGLCYRSVPSNLETTRAERSELGVRNVGPDVVGGCCAGRSRCSA